MLEKNHSSLPLNDQNQNFFIDGVSSRLIYEGSPCDAFPCWNGGTCTENGHKRKWRKRDKAYTCKCRAQFEGEHCEGRKAQKNSTAGADWCSTERQICPTGMICVVSNSADGQCLSIQGPSLPEPGSGNGSPAHLRDINGPGNSEFRFLFTAANFFQIMSFSLLLLPFPFSLFLLFFFLFFFSPPPSFPFSLFLHLPLPLLPFVLAFFFLFRFFLHFSHSLPSLLVFFLSLFSFPLPPLALSASPTEHLFPLPPLLLTFYGLFLFILLLLFCWAGNSSGFFLLLRKRNKRGQWREATLMGQRRSEYEPILEEEEGTAIEFGSGGIEMGKMDHRWAAEGQFRQGHALFAVDGTHPKALNSDSDLPSIPKIVHI